VDDGSASRETSGTGTVPPFCGPARQIRLRNAHAPLVLVNHRHASALMALHRVQQVGELASRSGRRLERA
jgi:hypothetical protein